MRMPLAYLSCALALIPITNFLANFLKQLSYSEKKIIASLLLVDLTILTVILYLSGGPENPFTIVYFVHVVLAAVLLDSFWTWLIAGLSCAAFTLLFFFYLPVKELSGHGGHHTMHGMSTHIQGMLLAYYSVVLLATYFLNRLVQARTEQSLQIERFKTQAENLKKLGVLATISASAAHEMSTPLNTILLASTELEHDLEREKVNREVISDLVLIKEESLRCKKILENLSEKTGDLWGESPVSLKVAKLIELAIEPLKVDKIKVEGDDNFILRDIPARAISTAIRALIKNSLDAIDGDLSKIKICIKPKDRFLQLSIVDYGVGISNENLNRIGEPFFSTKVSGGNLGLGFYLAKNSIEQIGGSLIIESKQGIGTTVNLEIPLNDTGR
jgi:two-component system sensor histidine kinase RegB